jgi:hypothetical protein
MTRLWARQIGIYDEVEVRPGLIAQRLTGTDCTNTGHSYRRRPPNSLQTLKANADINPNILIYHAKNDIFH